MKEMHRCHQDAFGNLFTACRGSAPWLRLAWLSIEPEAPIQAAICPAGSSSASSRRMALLLTAGIRTDGRIDSGMGHTLKVFIPVRGVD